MIRCVLFAAEERLITQIKSWIKPLDNKIRLDVFNSIEEFKQYRSVDIEGQRSEAFERDIAGGSDGKIVRLLIVDGDILPDPPLDAVLNLQAALREMDLITSVAPPRLLLMSHEGGHVKNDIFQNDAVDDLILKPLDRQVFQQKFEILSSDDPNVKPSFLFTAQTDLTIEVGKDVVIDEISEFGLAMRNPTALNPGLFATIHLDVLGEGAQARVFTRVYESVPHPNRAGEFLVRLTYFGLGHDQLSQIRKYIKHHQASHKHPRVEPRKIDLRNLGFGPARRFAVIDMDPNSLIEAQDILESGLKDVSVFPFTSYTRFHGDLLKLVSAQKVETPSSVDVQKAPEAIQAGEEHSSAFPTDKLGIVVRAGSANDLVRFEPPVEPHAIILGRDAEAWLSKPDLWMSAVDPEDRELIHELVSYAERGVKGKSTFRMHNIKGEMVYIEATGHLESAADGEVPAYIKLELKEIDSEKFSVSTGDQGATKGVKGALFFDFDAIFIDAALVRPTPEEWFQSLTALFRKSGVLKDAETPPPIIIMGDEKAWSKPHSFTLRGFHDYTLKPLDRRLLLLKTQALIANLNLARELDAPPFAQVSLHGKLAKEVKLSELSEYGLAVEQKSAFREHILMRFFSELFGDKGGAWVTGRSRHCQKSEKGDKYTCRFSFFGVSDEVLQRIRRWIREDYVAKKEGPE